MVGGRVGVAVPDLLPVHHVVVAVAHRAGLERREVGARLGLGEALAPQHVARGHAREVAGLLLGRAEAHDQRADVVEVHVLRTARLAGGPHLLPHDGLLPHRPVGAAVLRGPAQREPAPLRQLVAELAREGHRPLIVDEDRLPPRGQLVVEERAQLGAERLFLGGEVEVHGVTTLPRRAGTRRARRPGPGRTRRRTTPMRPRPRRRPRPAPSTGRARSPRSP